MKLLNKVSRKVVSLLLSTAFIVGVVSIGIGSSTASSVTWSASNFGAVAWCTVKDQYDQPGAFYHDMVNGDQIVLGLYYHLYNDNFGWTLITATVNGRSAVEIVERDNNEETNWFGQVTKTKTWAYYWARFDGLWAAGVGSHPCVISETVAYKPNPALQESVSETYDIHISCSHGDNATSSNVAANCTSGGYTAYHCNLCGADWTGNNTGALGHASANNRSCTQAETCSRCGTHLNPAYGH